MSRIQPASPHHGKAISAASAGAATKVKVRLAFVPRSTRSGSMSVPRARKQPARADDQDDEKSDVAGEDLPSRRQRRADRLRHGEDHAADQRAPHIAESADDDGLESENEPDRSGRRIEDGTDGKQH